MGAEKGNTFYKKIIDDYKKDHFILDDGSTNPNTVVDRVTSLLKESEKYNFKENIIQNINGINIYPTEYFCPMDFSTGKITLTNNTYTIHWYDMSWLSEKEKKWQAFSRKHNGKPDSSLIFLFVKEVYCHGLMHAIKLTINKIFK